MNIVAKALVKYKHQDVDNNEQVIYWNGQKTIEKVGPDTVESGELSLSCR